MTPLGVDLIATAAVAACLGWAGPKRLRSAIILCVLVGLLGWAGSYVAALLSLSFGGDTADAEDWLNGFSVWNASVEIGVALAWTFLWFGTARVSHLLIERGLRSST